MKTKLLILAILFSQLFFAQKKETLIEQELNHHIEMGEFRKNSQSIFNDIKEVISNKDKYLTLKINRQKVNEIINNNDKFISLEIPFSATETKTILLKKRQLLHEDFKLVLQTDKGLIEGKMPDYVAYSGIVADENMENSMTSITFINNSMRGIISIGNKEFTIGPKNDKDGILEYVLYEKNEVKLDLPEFACGTEDLSLDKKNHNKLASQQTTIPKCVTVHFEISHPLLNSFGGSSQSISSFINLFNNVQTFYNNENITLRVSYLMIWLIQDPYHSAESNGYVYYYFGNSTGVFNGNIGCLLGNHPGGGASTLGSNGVNNRRYNTCGGITNTSTNFPNYSWEVMVVSHELGHSLGSNHTHWCGWTGGALDNCFTTEGGCTQGTAPTNGGTIMSYCHLSSYGINFNNGFGTQPGNVIRNEVLNYNEFVSCETAQSCEDNVVSNVQINDNGQNYTISWSSLYPVKVYRRESISNTFSLLETVSSTSYVASYLTDCSVEKTEFKLVSVCPNGDSKPTVIVVEPKGKILELNNNETNNLCDNYQGDQKIISIVNPTFFSNYQWYKNNTIISNETNSTLLANQLGTYFCRATSQQGCIVDSENIIITQNLPIANFNINKNGLTIDFQNNSTCSNTANWVFGDGNNINTLNPSHTYSTAGIYDVCLNSSNLSGNNQICKSIRVFNTWIDDFNNQTDGLPNNQTYDSSLCGTAIKLTKNSNTDYTQNTYINYNRNEWISKQGTIEFLVKISNGFTNTSPNNNFALIFSLGNGYYDTQQTEIRANNSGSITFKRYNQSTNTYTAYSATTPFTYNQWFVISLSYGSQGTKLAVNGVVYQNQSWVNWEMNDGNLTLGQIFYQYQNKWLGAEGLIDKFRISNVQNDFQLTTSGLITPSFTQIPSFCSGSTISPLSTTSIEGITGTWTPAINNSSTTTYTFTPTAGQCAGTKTMTINVNPIVTPTFTPISGICPGTTNLGTIGNVSFVGDAIAGTAWNNDVDMYTTDNINYSLSSYTFNAGFIKFRKNHAWTINWGSNTFPTGTATQGGFNIPIPAGTYSINFNSASGVYSFGIPTNGSLPATSTNGVSGTWLPVFNNMATTTYTFTPTTGQCATTQTMIVTVNSPALPTGNSSQTFVQGQTLANLVVSGSNIIWYESATDAMNSINPLPTNTILVNGTTYYATQTINSCESDALAVTVSVSLNNLDFENANFMVYPNPVKDNLFIVNNKSLDLDNSIKIYDIQGRLVTSSLAILQNDNLVIDIRNLSSGLYFIQLQSKNDASNIKTIKIIKE